MRLRSALIAIIVVGCGDQSTEIISNPPPVGEITVSWSIMEASELPVSCEQAQVSVVEVSVGGVPERISCQTESDGQVSFVDLIAGRYPVVIRLLALGDIVLQEHFANVEVIEGATEYAHAFVVGLDDGMTGQLSVRWLLAGEEPATACAVFGGDRVVIEDQPGSIAPLQEDLSCTAGQLEIDALQGDYTLRFTLLDASRQPIPAGIVQRNFRIVVNQTTTDLISFPLVPAPRAAVRLEWTVNGAPPADECVIVGGQELSMELFQQRSSIEEISIRTATAACAAGVLQAGDLVASSDPARLRFRVSAALRGFAGLVLTSTTVSGVRLRAGETSTIAFDLQVE